MEEMESQQLTEAVIIWTGWGRAKWPRRDDSLVIGHFGVGLAAALLPKIKTLMKDFYESEAKTIASDLQEMGKISTEQFKKKHPEIPNEIARAFAWCYTFDFK